MSVHHKETEHTSTYNESDFPFSKSCPSERTPGKHHDDKKAKANFLDSKNASSSFLCISAKPSKIKNYDDNTQRIEYHQALKSSYYFEKSSSRYISTPTINRCISGAMFLVWFRIHLLLLILGGLHRQLLIVPIKRHIVLLIYWRLTWHLLIMTFWRHVLLLIKRWRHILPIISHLLVLLRLYWFSYISRCV